MASEAAAAPSASRKQAPRFTAEEKSLLLSLVNNHKKVLECKKTDVASVNAKCEAWQKLAVEYNAQHGVTPRHFKQLKKCWGNMKQKWKEENAAEKRKIHKTEEHRSPGNIQSGQPLMDLGVTAGADAPDVNLTAPASDTPPVDEAADKENAPEVPDKQRSSPRPPTGRMALLERTLSAENEVRIALLREEHAMRMRLMEEELKRKNKEHELKMEILQNLAFVLLFHHFHPQFVLRKFLAPVLLQSMQSDIKLDCMLCICHLFACLSCATCWLRTAGCLLRTLSATCTLQVMITLCR
ncbi:hypothetical protein HPB50_029407 [Hyalomma asiaticum]|nr:hypothetical protein HPB50_029407 [Hyalomma asiaticum]